MFPGSMEDQTGVPEHFCFGKLIFGNEPDYIRQMQNFFHAGVGGFCGGNKLLHSGWKGGSQALLGRRRNIFQHEKSCDGYEGDDFDGFQHGVEYHSFFEFRVKITYRVTRNHMDVEKLHFPSSSLAIKDCPVSQSSF